MFTFTSAHMRTHTCVHARMLTHTHTLPHACMHAHMLTHACSFTQLTGLLLHILSHTHSTDLLWVQGLGMHARERDLFQQLEVHSPHLC